MSFSKRFLETKFGDNWGFNLDGSFTAGRTTIRPRPKDLLNNCQQCKGLGKRTVMRKIRGRFKPVVITCECTPNNL